jgi:hypothetical protein
MYLRMGIRKFPTMGFCQLAGRVLKFKLAVRSHSESSYAVVKKKLSNLIYIVGA